MSYLSPFSMRRIIKYAVNARTVIATEIMRWNSISAVSENACQIKQGTAAHEQSNCKNNPPRHIVHIHPPSHCLSISTADKMPKIAITVARPFATREISGGGFAMVFNKAIISSMRPKNAFSSTLTSINQFRAVGKGYFSGLAFGGLPLPGTLRMASRTSSEYKLPLNTGECPPRRILWAIVLYGLLRRLAISSIVNPSIPLIIGNYIITLINVEYRIQ